METIESLKSEIRAIVNKGLIPENLPKIRAINKNASWPNTCIDWEQAARELMCDYSESNGYYFRSL